VQEKMEALFRKLESPVLTDIHLDWANDNIESWPEKIPDLYLGEPLMLSIKISSLPESISVNGQIAGNPWNTSLKLTGGQDNSGIAVLWARKKITGLMNQHHRNDQIKDTHRKIIETALKHHLVSKYTSLVAVDITPARVQEEILKSHALPVNLPAGWEYEKVFGQRPIPAMTTGALPTTATPAQFKIIIGILLLIFSLLFGLTRQYVFNV
jgi:Ca-activated chloride channel family protein